MKLWIVSDLHCESYSWIPNYLPDFDVLVIAGDVSEGVEATRKELSILHRRTRKPIVFVCGNHDFFGADLLAFHGTGTAWPVHVLPAGKSVIIDGVRFVGATLWTDFALAHDVYASEAWAAGNMPEYRRVTRSDGDLIWPTDTSDQHAMHRARIEAVLAIEHDGPTVVVTHHAPSSRSLSGGHPIEGAAFASDLEPLIERWRPALWVHGHVHKAADYRVDGTRVVCNPRGYEAAGWYEPTGCSEDLVVEV